MSSKLITSLVTVIRAVVIGVGVALIGIVPWTYLIKWNTVLLPQLPWGVAAMAVLLWCYWRFLNGHWGFAQTADARYTLLRATPLSGDVWGAALMAGMLGMIALMPWMSVLGRLVELPADELGVPPTTMPPATIFTFLLMSSLVAGVIEEAAYRGYMQGALERRFGPVAAILITGLVFALGHYSHHPDGMLVMLPYYLAVSALWGTLAYVTQSILPGLALHAFGDVWVLTRQWISGAPGWQAAPQTPSLIWETGIDAAFIASCITFAIFATASVLAFFALAKVVREERPRSILHHSNS